jgi:RNA polymerase-binding transcription factor DksA
MQASIRVRAAGNESYARLVGESGDAADAAAAALVRDVAEAEIRRDVLEVRDIVAAEGRIASGRYGLCTDCGVVIGYPRLSAYPTAKRCLACQQAREKGGPRCKQSQSAAPDRRSLEGSGGTGFGTTRR